MILDPAPAAADPCLNPADPACMRAILDGWTASGWLRPLDRAFGAFLWREVPDASPWLILAASLASHQLGRGHVCLDLAATLENPAMALSLPPHGDDAVPEATTAPVPPRMALRGLTLDAWCETLAHPRLTGQGVGLTPLVLTGHRLYLSRYWRYEQSVRRGIRARLDLTDALAAELPLAGFRQTLDRLFPRTARSGPPPDWQKIACALAARNVFSIITGGPGTGKTTTVLRLLALLQALALGAPAARPLRIRLAAPTGKAAARLGQSIAGAVDRLDLSGMVQPEAVRDAIPRAVTTLHRLLGGRPDTRRFRHDSRHPLPLDVLVIDEASMIDLEMMAAVLAALPARARLILLGDKDQLASVEAGAVLGELCRRAEQGHYTPATADWLRHASSLAIPDTLVDVGGKALDQAVIMLRHSHRFDADSGIGRLARAVNAGDAGAARALLQHPPADLSHLSIREQDDTGFERLIMEGGEPIPAGRPERPARCGYRQYLSLLDGHRPLPAAPAEDWDDWARQVLQAHARFQVLCALRQGPWGVEGLNRRIEALLSRRKLIHPRGEWYEGRPVLVTRNDYGLGLMNGDIGMTLATPAPATGVPDLRVAFLSGDGTPRIHWVMPSRLREVETVFALTVHKSQGSEFTHAALVLPDRPNPILTRELLYTGITRASHWFSLANAGNADTLAEIIVRRVLRDSGLGDDSAEAD